MAETASTEASPGSAAVEVRDLWRAYGDSWALDLYADEACTTSAGTVYFEIANTSAKAYRLLRLPT